ncbi:MAG: AgmX/PglI C-terminal domain-containing protein [Myxococcota bacterium]|nr:AgmX/PglI C-terminal domain-containing protein [Myxococcota bacterium]
MTQGESPPVTAIRVLILRRGKVVRSYKTCAESLSIGTAKTCTIRVAGDSSIKSKHVSVYFEDGVLVLLPEPGAEVWLNGELVDYALPSPTDVIKTGRLTFSVGIASPDDSVVSSLPSAGKRLADGAKIEPMRPDGLAKAHIPRLPRPSTPGHSKARESMPPSSAFSGAAAVPESRVSAMPRPVTPEEMSPISWPKEPSESRGAKASSSPAQGQKEALRPVHRADSRVPRPKSAPPPVPMGTRRPPATPEPAPGREEADWDSDDLPKFETDGSLEEELSTVVESWKNPEPFVHIAPTVTRSGDTLAIATREVDKPAEGVFSSIDRADEPPASNSNEGALPMVEEAAPVRRGDTRSIATRISRGSPERAISEATTEAREGGTGELLDEESYFEQEDLEEQHFEEPFDLAEVLLSEPDPGIAEAKGAKARYCAAHVVRMVSDRVVEVAAILPGQSYTPHSQELHCTLNGGRLFIRSLKPVTGELHRAGMVALLSDVPLKRKWRNVMLVEGDQAVLEGERNSYCIEVYRPPLVKRERRKRFDRDLLKTALIALGLQALFALTITLFGIVDAQDRLMPGQIVVAEVEVARPNVEIPWAKGDLPPQLDAIDLSEKRPFIGKTTLQRIESCVAKRKDGGEKPRASLRALVDNLRGGGALAFVVFKPAQSIRPEAAAHALETRADGPAGMVTREPGDLVIRGTMSPLEIEPVVAANFAAVEECYKSHSTGDPKLAGRAVFHWTVGRDGAVMEAHLGESTLGNLELTQCILDSIMQWRFPIPQGWPVARIAYPFVFESAPL